MKIIRWGSLTPVSETPPQKSKMVPQVLFSYLYTLIIFSLVKTLHTAKNWSFPIRISSVNVTKPQIPADLVTFTEEIFNGKFHLLCSVERLSWYFLCAKNKVFHWPISCQWSLFIPPENIRKRKVSYVFRGYRKRSAAWHGLCLSSVKVNNLLITAV